MIFSRKDWTYLIGVGDAEDLSPVLPCPPLFSHVHCLEFRRPPTARVVAEVKKPNTATIANNDILRVKVAVVQAGVV